MRLLAIMLFLRVGSKVQWPPNASQKKGLTYFSLTDVSLAILADVSQTSRIQSSTLQACQHFSHRAYPSDPPTVMQRIGVCSGVNHTISSNTFLWYFKALLESMTSSADMGSSLSQIDCHKNNSLTLNFDLVASCPHWGRETVCPLGILSWQCPSHPLRTGTGSQNHHYLEPNIKQTHTHHKTQYIIYYIGHYIPCIYMATQLSIE